jgi:uncharacterized membrane protein YccC
LLRRIIKLFTDRRIWVRQISVAAIAGATAWQVGDLAFKNGGLVAAIVCSLSIRISLHKSIREGFGQIIGTAIGAGVALLIVSIFHFGFIAVGATIIFCSVVARALHLGEVASINVPVTALIVIGPGLNESTAWRRLISTLIGAGIAIVFSYFSHPKTPAARAVDQIASLGTRSALLLGEMSEGVAVGYTQQDAGSWLSRARLLMEEIPTIRAQALEVRGFARWFPTADQEVAEEIYGRGVAVEHTVVQVRTIARTLFDSVVDGGISTASSRRIAQALSIASMAISTKVAQLKSKDLTASSDAVGEEVRRAGAALAESLIDEADDVEHEQLVRSISLVTNLDRIADSLDESSPALKYVDTPDEPSVNKILQVSPLEQTKRLSSKIKHRLPRVVRKYF